MIAEEPSSSPSLENKKRLPGEKRVQRIRTRIGGVAQVKWGRGVQNMPERGNRIRKTIKGSCSIQQLVVGNKRYLVLLDVRH